MEQPESYDNPEELIKWLKCDLKRQRYEGIAEENLMLNIGNIDNIDNTDNIELIQNFQYDKFIETEIKFSFNFKDILKELLKLENKEPKYNEKNIICYYRLNAISVTFSKEAYFNYSTFSKETYFVTSIFSGYADFIFSTFNGGVTFNYSFFREYANFGRSTFGTSTFERSIFSGYADFTNSTFSEDADFVYSIFSDEVCFSDSNFTDEAWFLETTFSKGAYFERSTFSKKVYFGYIKFVENEQKDRISIIFDNIKLENNSYIIFDNINYDDEKNENSKIEIINTVINGRLDFNNVFISELNLEGSNIIGIFNKINFKGEPINSDTACILKNEELKKNNTIKALEFKAIEKDKYTKELFNKIITLPKNLGEAIKKVSYIFDYLSILLSKISNNHGQNWGQAVIFTIVMFVGCFAIYYAPYYGSPVKYSLLEGEFFSELIKYFVPINYSSLEEYVKIEYIPPFVRVCGVVVYMFGKIGTAYGIVQIVQAFRKFNKAT